MRKNAVVIKPTEVNSYYKACGKKKAYSKREALETARKACKRGAAKKMGVYACFIGDHWHLTHIKDFIYS